MAATAAQIERLRRMVDEPTDATYDDALLAEIIESYPLMDERGEEAYTYDTSTSPPTRDENDEWVATYDLNAAAADVWDEKAAAAAEDFDFSADGGSYKRSQAALRYESRARYYRMRRAPRTMALKQWPEEGREYSAYDLAWIVNLRRVDES